MPRVTITFGDSDVNPPVFVAGSFTDWQPVELEPGEGSSSGPFNKTFEVEPGRHQYKFRLGVGDWWVCNLNANRANDEAGNENNILVVPSDSTGLPHQNKDSNNDKGVNTAHSESSQTKHHEYQSTKSESTLISGTDVRKAPQEARTEQITPRANGDVKPPPNQKDTTAKTTSKAGLSAGTQSDTTTKMDSAGHDSGSSSSHQDEKSIEIPTPKAPSGTTSRNSVLLAAAVVLALPVFVSWLWSR